MSSFLAALQVIHPRVSWLLTLELISSVVAGVIWISEAWQLLCGPGVQGFFIFRFIWTSNLARSSRNNRFGLLKSVAEQKLNIVLTLLVELFFSPSEHKSCDSVMEAELHP